jgi:hypothetical protein
VVVRKHGNESMRSGVPTTPSPLAEMPCSANRPDPDDALGGGGRRSWRAAVGPPAWRSRLSARLSVALGHGKLAERLDSGEQLRLVRPGAEAVVAHAVDDVADQHVDPRRCVPEIIGSLAQRSQVMREP